MSVDIQELIVQMIANAPVVAVLIYLLFRQEKVFAEMLERYTARIEVLENRETTDPSELDFKR